MEPCERPSGEIPNQLVDAKRLLEIIFEESSRPSLRWLRAQQEQRAIPFVKRGRLVFFDPSQVLESFRASATIKSRL
jgi:hypothetical protein